MNFSSQSIKLKSKQQNEDFSFDLETPRGHFFAVLDFGHHDFANLNATLKGKLETIVGSFVSLATFSADLFLGFLAKEINNYLFNLSEQSGGPELGCSAALSLVSGDRVSYFRCGDVKISVLRSGETISSAEAGPAKVEQPAEPVSELGLRHLETPLTDRIETISLQDEDVVLITTPGLDDAIEKLQADEKLTSSAAAEISESLVKASNAVNDDRTFVVIAGPYERPADPALADLSKAVASLEARVSALAGVDDSAAPVPLEPAADGQLEQRFGQQIEVLKDDLRGKAAKIDLLELDEKLKNLTVVLAGKADTAEVLGLQRDVLKLGLAANTASGLGSDAAANEMASSESGNGAGEVNPQLAQEAGSRGSFSTATALLILFIAIAGAFAGAWLQSRINRKPPEVWSVKTSGNQIHISRLDSGQEGSVAINSPNALESNGEQTFSSFADVKQYVDTLTAPRPTSAETPQSNQAPAAPSVTEITLRPGDSLKRIAQQYNVPEQRVKELNPNITRWPQVRAGQRIVVPAPPAASPSATPPGN